MTYFLIGSNGRLGRAMLEILPLNRTRILNRNDYKDWGKPNCADKVSSFFDAHQEENLTIFVTAGLLDPTSRHVDLISANYILPRNIIEGTKKFGARVVTFGSVMEDLVKLKNNYLESKRLLKEYAQSLDPKKVSILHIQLHTLYGTGQPSAHMFLGQILSALKNNSKFKMTSGRQIREYHHFQDDAKAIQRISNSGVTGCFKLNHGKPESLRNIAKYVFADFKKSDLLEIDPLREVQEENFGIILPKSYGLQECSFRDTLPSIAHYIKTCL